MSLFEILQLNIFFLETMILEQRNLKITDELEMHKKKEIVMNRSIAFLYNKLAALNGQLCKKKEDKSVLNEDNNLVQVDYVGLLKVIEY